MWGIFHFSFLYLFLFVFGRSESKELELFVKNGKQKNNYDQLIDSIRPNDVLIMPNGLRYKIVGRIDAGNVTVLFDIGDGRAIRLPKAVGDFQAPFIQPKPYTEYIKSYLALYKQLKEAGVRVVEVFDESVSGQYAIVKKLLIEFTLQDLIRKSKKFEMRNAEFEEKVWNDFVEFSKTLYFFTWIEDLDPRQIGYANGKWVLFDWGGAAHDLKSFVKKMI